MSRLILYILLICMFLIHGIKTGYTANKEHIKIDSDGKGEVAGKTDDYKLFQNFPNPFNPVTRISYKINLSGFVTLKVYNLVGQVIRVLVEENQKPGRYEVEFDATDLSSGIYLYKLEINDFSSVKRMTLLK